MTISINITTPAPSIVPVITSSIHTSQIPTISLNTTSAAMSDLPTSSRLVSSEVTTPASSTSHPQETSTSEQRHRGADFGVVCQEYFC